MALFNVVRKSIISSSLMALLAMHSSGVLAGKVELSERVTDKNELGRIVQQYRSDDAIVLPDRNVAVIDQSGTMNSALINQKGIGPGLAMIYQRGYGNEASVNQQGAFNIGLVSQSGNFLEASLEQGGREFEASINQRGINGQIQVLQSGSGYRALTVDQLSRSGVGTTATIVTR